jgi:hypothetical protein
LKFIRAYTIFCEHIRVELGGTDTLIGVLPSIVQLPVPPSLEASSVILPISCFTRIEFDNTQQPPKLCNTSLVFDGLILAENPLSQDFLENEFKSTRANGLKFAAFNVRLAAHGLPLATKNGMLELKIYCDDEVTTSGQLHIRFETHSYPQSTAANQ